ncbi:peptidoglycan recognition protein family protein [Stackebrandtia nassauensis]|uniref:N-acetylmuramyl-L-alanine amidase, negative regulator of AmpC, AmpD n=1 Tax=Stackebrandtia nassauensis (strain DSM 44728 / CIP 108903 / NRRL B-16338 / NBRC 102104 / LLR-40K-21) TaxID=446470 RepID=D3PZF1_STANL|nr:peptidoglycan recognition family protein [Stackebrandtia nassauensis]ADD41625.1 N-acetylmuramyl-L-alanine amidase, negative regulator of AmpC, AmpD [Stackebrandtia nassauensis DSM 44728]
MSPIPPTSRRNLLRGAIVVGAGTAVGGAALLTTSVAHADAKAPEITSCADWGAREPSGELTQLDANPTKIVIHHTASGNSGGEDQESSNAFAREVQSWHMDGNGWSDTGQHFTVTRGGFALEGRHTSLQHLTDGAGFVQGAHSPGANTDGVGIENQGTFTDSLPPEALYNKLVELCAYICTQWGIDPKEIYGHRDFYNTECPGQAFYDQLPKLREDVAAAVGG